MAVEFDEIIVTVYKIKAKHAPIMKMCGSRNYIASLLINNFQIVDCQ